MPRDDADPRRDASSEPTEPPDYSTLCRDAAHALHEVTTEIRAAVLERRPADAADWARAQHDSAQAYRELLRVDDPED